MKKRDRVERLLARGHLGGPARERIFERVLRTADIASQRRRYRRRWLIGLAPAAIGVAVAILLLRPAPNDGFRMKGGGVDWPVIEATCTVAIEGGCARRGKLVVRVEALREAAFLVGYVTPAGRDDVGARRWFSPASDDRLALPVGAGAASQILPEGVPLESFQPGRYDVHLRLVSRPVARADALTVPALARSTTTLTVLP